MRKFAFIFTSIIWLLSLQNAAGQDPQFSQFYAAPTYLNPAFAGATQQYRVGLNYRNQWPQIPGAFETYNLSVDAYIPEVNSSLGLIATADNAGSGALKYTSVGGLFGYEFRVTRKVVIKPAIQFSVYKYGVDANKLVFADQLIRGLGRSSVEYVDPNPGLRFDLAAGGLIYSEAGWLGFSGHHLTRLNQSLTGQISNIPEKWSLHGGYRFVLRKSRDRITRALWAAANIKEQAGFRQLDLGFYTEFYPVIFGFWYRGIPVGNSDEEYHRNTDAIISMIGLKLDQFRFGYSYDLTISKLAGSTGGAHEISLSFEFVDPRPKKRDRRMVPCPTF